jgi:hypothetical protein
MCWDENAVPIDLQPTPFIGSTERPSGPTPEMFVGSYSVRRVPLPMLFDGEPVASVVHEQDREAVISDPGAPEVAVDRTELAERAFQAGAFAMFQELIAAGLLDPQVIADRYARGRSSPAVVAAGPMVMNPPGTGPVVTMSGCFRVRLAYPDRVEDRGRR